METADQIKADRNRIEELGGPTEVAKKLKYDIHNGGAQRVQNWLTRGIPARVRLDRPDLFPLKNHGRIPHNRRSTDKGGE